MNTTSSGVSALDDHGDCREVGQWGGKWAPLPPPRPPCTLTPSPSSSPSAVPSLTLSPLKEADDNRPSY
jgi:hypothetical protein